jgi:cell division protein FtsA
MNQNERIIIGLDVGTTKTCCLVVHAKGTESYKVLGYGLVTTQGLKKGNVVELTEVSSTVKLAVEQAKKTSGLKFSKIILAISGSHISGLNNIGMVAVKSGQVDEYDLKRVEEGARTFILPEGIEIIHSLIQEYQLDELSEIKNPIGLYGKKLQVKSHIVTANTSLIKNFITSVERAGLKVEHLVLQPICSAESSLTEREKEIGCLLIDIGGGTTDLIAIKNHQVYYTEVIPIGGNHFSSDISVALNMSFQEAESLKKEKGKLNLISQNEALDNSNKIHSHDHNKNDPDFSLDEIIQYRTMELFQKIFQKISDKKILNKLGAGVILCGGGSMLPNLTQVVSLLLERPVRVARPSINKWTNADKFNSPQFSTILGLIEYHNKMLNSKNRNLFKEAGPKHFNFSLIKNIPNNVKQVIQDLL